MADRHGEFTTHQPSPPVCLLVKCVDVKRKKKRILKKCPTFSPVSPCQKKKPQEKSGRSPFKKNVDNLLFPTELPDLPEDLPHNQHLQRLLQEDKKKEHSDSDTSFDPSDSLFSDGETSAIFKLNTPTKRTKLSEVIFSSGEDDEVLGYIQPFENSKTNFIQTEDPFKDPRSPLDRSTPISYSDGEGTQVFSVSNQPETLSKKTHKAITLYLQEKQLQTLLLLVLLMLHHQVQGIYHLEKPPAEGWTPHLLIQGSGETLHVIYTFGKN